MNQEQFLKRNIKRFKDQKYEIMYTDTCLLIVNSLNKLRVFNLFPASDSIYDPQVLFP